MTCKVDMSGLCCGFSAATNATKSDFGEENKIGHDEEEPMSSANSNAPPFVDRFIVSPRAVHEFLRVASVMRIVVEAEASYALNMNCAAREDCVQQTTQHKEILPKHTRWGATTCCKRGSSLTRRWVFGTGSHDQSRATISG